MRDFFPGYFTPTKKEFDELWREATFAFDANVLLGLYRLTVDARPAFFDILEKLDPRLFLPNQAAHEYLRNRLTAISARLASFEEVKRDTKKFVEELRTRLRDHSVTRGTEIIETAEKASAEIANLADTAISEEPDMLESDQLLLKLSAIFDDKTGQPYKPPQLEELYKKAAIRFEKKIPPGYKDQAKQEPNRYGDALIWFQLLDHASATKKPLIFVTRDTKEDWWLEHNGRTVGPRPELINEMAETAGVRFHMYTTPRFLEFAQQFFALKAEPTNKATFEFQEIEKQDRQASFGVDAFVSIPANQFVGVLTEQPAWNQIAWNKPVWAQPPWASPAWSQPGAVTYVAGLPAYATSGAVSPTSFKTLSPEEEALQSKHYQLLPIHGQRVSSSTGKWKCEIASPTKATENDRILYHVRFEPEDRIGQPRNLVLWVSASRLEQDLDWKYKQAIFRRISEWLGTNLASGEVTLLG